ncbi:LOW QUALITY PROTEIN: hypothetical protein U9M48_002571 [Paspalum notatum var. saurae]|uniref:Reverse transcriptase domain-containing protein n=1 Tax=Paspalum notatum var. saurae TaxID=547442 RepID=A0AAQ3SJX5_PASNO
MLKRRVNIYVTLLVDGGLSMLQYADDTILLMEHNLEQAKNMKIILRAFEKLSGLKINFQKSELFCYGEAKDFIFGYGVGNLPFRYLGIPMNHKKLSNKDLKQVEERFQKKLSGWIGKIYFFLASHKKKYRLARWEILCLPKEQGGLGIRNLEIQNICLLSKWLYKLINEEGVWQNILKKKYLRGKSSGEVQWKPGDSHFWSGLMKVKEHFLQLSSFNIHDGSPSMGVILTKDNLLKRHWSGDGRCCFCDTNETIQHLFFDYIVAKNEVIFDERRLYSYLQIIFQSNLLDTVMERSSKKRKKTATQMGMAISRDPSNGDFCQPRMEP